MTRRIYSFIDLSWFLLRTRRWSLGLGLNFLPCGDWLAVFTRAHDSFDSGMEFGGIGSGEE